MNPDWRCANAAFAWRNTSARRVGGSGYCDYAAALNPMRLNWLTRRAPGRAWTARAGAGARPFATVRGPPGPVWRRAGRVSASVIQTLFVYVHTATVSPQSAAARHCPPGHWQPALWPLSQPALCGGVPCGFLSLPYRRCLLLCTQQQNKSDIRDLLEDIRQY